MMRYQQQKKALGSDALFTLVTDKETVPDQIFSKLWDMTNEFENRFSRFLPDSELTRFNADAGERVKVSDQFAELLASSIDMSNLTNGLFNPFILPALNKSGYIGSWPNTKTFQEDLNYEDRSRFIDASYLKLKSDCAKIPPGSAIDFGGIGKGFLLDKIASYLKSKNIQNFWLSLGGDILCCGYDLNEKPWSISIAHATKAGVLVGDIINDDGQVLAIATSGITKRKGVKNRKQWHHIIDPRSGEPAKTDILTATVTASSATEADVLAKCIVIVGSDKAKKMVEKYKIKMLHMQLISGKSYILKYVSNKQGTLS